MSDVFIRAEVLGGNAAGQKHIPLLANNADGIHFWTDDKSIIRSIEPQRTGRWIHQAKFGRIECDQCGKVYRNAFAPKNYCPNCGARMEDEG